MTREYVQEIERVIDLACCMALKVPAMQACMHAILSFLLSSDQAASGASMAISFLCPSCNEQFPVIPVWAVPMLQDDSY
jgi:hypothetical protein